MEIPEEEKREVVLFKKCFMCEKPVVGDPNAEEIVHECGVKFRLVKKAEKNCLSDHFDDTENFKGI